MQKFQPDITNQPQAAGKPAAPATRREAMGMAAGGRLVLIVMIAVGGGMLVAMRASSAKSMPNDVVATAEAKIDAAISKIFAASRKSKSEKLTPAPATPDARKLAETLMNNPAEQQVDYIDLGRNPFAIRQVSQVSIEQTVSQPAATAPALTPEQLADQQWMEMIEDLEEELEEMTLQSILSGKTSVAVIDGVVVRVGDEIGSFKVVEINASGVELEAEGELFSLVIELPDVGIE